MTAGSSARKLSVVRDAVARRSCNESKSYCRSPGNMVYGGEYVTRICVVQNTVEGPVRVPAVHVVPDTHVAHYINVVRTIGIIDRSVRLRCRDSRIYRIG